MRCTPRRGRRRSRRRRSMTIPEAHVQTHQTDLEQIAARIDARRERYIDLSDRIWDFAELRFQEHRSVEAQISAIEAEGFRVTRDVAGMPTAFVAEAGSGSPIIGFLGEYDALAGLSQEAGVADPRPARPGDAGQGCGHNLLGAGSML